MRHTIFKLILGITVTGALSGIALADNHIAKGEKVFKKCAACHSVEANKNKVGPSMFGIYGRNAGTLDYKYSKAMLESGIVWNEAELDEFLKSPKKFLKKSKMTFRGIRKDDQRSNLIAFLKTLGE